MKLDAFHQRMRVLFVAELQHVATMKAQGVADPDVREMAAEIDDILNTCPSGEICRQCGDLFCPWGEPLHFHHDGCPCCSTGEDSMPEDERRARLLERNTRPEDVP